MTDPRKQGIGASEAASFDAELVVPAMEFTPWQEGMRIEPRHIYTGMPDTLYHSGPGISKSGLDQIAQSPAHYQWSRLHPAEDTPATIVGRAFHCLALEPETFAARFVRSPFEEFRTKEAKEWRADQEAAGRAVLRSKSDDPVANPSEWDLVHQMCDAIRAHPTAGILLNPADGIWESSAYWVDAETHKLCRCRPDFLNLPHNVCCDLKTTTDAGLSAFARSCAEYRYDVQASMYRDGLREAGHGVEAFIFIAIENAPPYGIGVYTLSAEDRRIGRIKYRDNLRTYARCMESGEWPNYPPDIREIELPEWGRRGKPT